MSWRICLGFVVLLAGGAYAQEECASCDKTGVIVGAIFGTLAFCIIVGVIIFFCLRRKKQRDAAAGADQNGNKSKAGSGHSNPAYMKDGDPEAGMSPCGPPASPDDYASKGFGGYVACKEFESPNKEKIRNL